MNKRVLIIATSNTSLGNTGKPTGVWAEELVIPYYELVDAGASVEIATPKGGPLAFDPASLKPPGQNDALTERFLGDPTAQAQAEATHVAADVDAAVFDAVFFPGGHGTMWDLPVDAGVTQAVEAAFNAGALVASVCHGAAGLVTARRPDGNPVVHGKRISSFTDAEEEAVGLAKVVPFQLESRLRQLGAHFEGAPNWQAFAVRDGQFITGQNPQSSKLVAQQLVSALGLVHAAQAV
ncbi:MAG TPA: type 1 glutamine amidotransferase domain-containing protein [Rubrivivax sp.]|nr:type 1 glutamine amidotransferase domain-containing protein [Rubrivivax sp.]